MPSETVEIRLATSGENEFRRVAQELRAAGAGKLQLALRRNLRATATPILNDLRAAVLAVQVQSSRGGVAPPDYSRQLRARIASALRVDVAFKGVRFVARANAIGPWGGTLAKYLDSEIPGYKRWRHPVFGNQRVWVEQYGSPWFFTTIRRYETAFEAACYEAVQSVLRDISR